MTPEEENYEEAKRRIQEAEDNKSVELDLSKLSRLTRFPPELAALSSLQSASSVAANSAATCPLWQSSPRSNPLSPV
jgi:hypothetical protein